MLNLKLKPLRNLEHLGKGEDHALDSANLKKISKKSMIF